MLDFSEFLFGISTEVIGNIFQGFLPAVPFRSFSRLYLVVVSKVFCCDLSQITRRGSSEITSIVLSLINIENCPGIPLDVPSWNFSSSSSWSSCCDFPGIFSKISPGIAYGITCKEYPEKY